VDYALKFMIWVRTRPLKTLFSLKITQNMLCQVSCLLWDPSVVLTFLFQMQHILTCHVWIKWHFS